MIKNKRFLIIPVALLSFVFIKILVNSGQASYNDDMYHADVCGYIENNIYYTWSLTRRDTSFTPCCDYYFLGADSTYIYVYSGGADFCYENNMIYLDNGCLCPIRIKYKFDQQSIVFVGFDVPNDGDEYTATLKQIFPSKMIKKMTFSNQDYQDLKELAFMRACNHYNVEYVPNSYETYKNDGKLHN